MRDLTKPHFISDRVKGYYRGWLVDQIKGFCGSIFAIEGMEEDFEGHYADSVRRQFGKLGWIVKEVPVENRKKAGHWFRVRLIRRNTISCTLEKFMEEA